MTARAGLALLLVLPSMLAGCSLGPTAAVTFHTGMADSAEGAISVEADGWTYSLPLDVAWVDDLAWHEGDRPGCLPPGRSRLVRFAAVEVAIEGATWRPVIWVDCRG